MFNLKSKVRQIAATFMPQPNPQVIIAEIHEAFDSASEKLLNEAKSILSGKYDIEIGRRLSKVGFTKSKKATEAANVIFAREQSERVAKLIDIYQIHYPNNKFITAKIVQQICKKYGLLLGDVEYFIGDVPEKNLKEIEEFKKIEKMQQAYKPDWYKYVGEEYIICNKGEGGAYYGYMFLRNDLSSYFQRMPEGETHFYEPQRLQICASVKDFDTRNMDINEGYKLELKLPDPIVLQPVIGGYVVVSKWGLEASEQMIVNEKHN